MNASSESGECASLISTGSFSVFEAVCWPDMGLSVSYSSAAPARPGHSTYKLRSGCLALVLVPPRETFPPKKGLSETNGRNLRVAGACVALGRAISCKRKPSISASGEQLGRDKQGKRISGFQALQRGDHACDGVVERSSAVKIRLPEFLQQLEIVIPAALIQAFAQRIRSITAAGHATIVVASGRARRAKHRTYDFTGSVENESLPEVARDGFVTLVALANDGGLHGVGNTMRTFMEKNFESCRALITRI